MRRLLLVCTVVAILVLVWFAFRRPAATHRITFLTYFQKGVGLRSGAPVRVDGVDLGSVTSVQVRPELGDHPIEVVMAVSSAYELSIPADSKVILGAGGVLGPTLVDIDTRDAHGPPAGTGTVLKSVEVPNDQAAHAMERIGNALVKASKNMRDGQTQATAASPAGK